MNPWWSSQPAAGLVCAALATVAGATGCHVATTATAGDSAVLDDGGGGGTDAVPGDSGCVGAGCVIDGGSNTAPVLTLQMPPPGPVLGDVPYSYTLADAESDLVSIAVTYAIAAGGALPAAEGPGSDGTSGLSASPAGDPHLWVWASAADLPADVDAVAVCFTPDDGIEAGATVCAPAVDVRNGAAVNVGVKINEVGVGVPDYVEIVNTGAAAVDVSAWQVEWTSTNGATGSMVIPPLALMPGDVVELREGMGIDGPNVVHVGSNFEWDQGLGGSAELIDTVLASVDFVRWGGAGATPAPPGVWTESAPLATPTNGIEGLSRASALDTDDAADFCVTGASPGMANPPCPPPPAPIAVGAVLVTEVDTGDFGGSPDRIELFNATAATINLSGAVLVVEDEGFVTPYALPGFALAAGARVMIVDNQGTAGADTIELPDNLNWFDGTGAMSVGLEDAFGSGVDFVRFGASAETAAAPAGWTGSVPVPGLGGSASRVPDATDSDSDADWCASPDSPLLANSCLTVASDVTVVINELTTGFPDWVELANPGTADADITGWTLVFTNGGFGGADVFAFDAPAVVPAGGFLVVADGDPGVAWYDTGFFNIDWGGMSGNQGSVALVDPSGTGEDFVRFGGNTSAPPAGTGWTQAAALPTVSGTEFLNRESAAGAPVDTDDAADWCVLTASTANAVNPVCP